MVDTARMGRRALPGLAALACLLIAAPAAAAPRPRNLWATINVCDTQASPDRLGVRARMPGNGTRQVMYMRFRAQYYEESTGTWRDVGGAARSPLIRLGSARVRHRETGYTFAFTPPPEGSRFVLRGVVEFQWRERRRVGRRVRRVRRGGRVRRVVVRRGRVRNVVVRRAWANTKRGFESARGSDPPGFSAGLCVLA